MKIFLSCGMGDFLAVETFMSDAEKAAVTEVYFCTRQSKLLQQIIEASNMFPKLQKCVSIHDTWWEWDGGDVWSIAKRDDPENCLPFCVWEKYSVEPTVGKTIPEPLLTELVDLCVGNVLKDIDSGKRTLHKSSVYQYITNANIPTPNLPNSYVAIHPCSFNLPADHRDFTTDDWKHVIGFLQRNETTGVIVNNVPERDLEAYNALIPQEECIIDLTNQTDLITSMKIVEQATTFIGCASVLSVLFSQNKNRWCFLKTTIPSDSDAMWFYYQKSPFVNPSIKITI